MRWNDGVLGGSRFLGQPAAALENRALHQHSRHYPADARMAHEQAVREAGSAPELGDAQVDGADRGRKRALPVAVPLVALGACVLCLGVHDLVYEGLRHDADELLDVCHPVVGSRHLRRSCACVL